MTVSMDEMKAIWAFSEMDSDRHPPFWYAGVQHLRQKKQAGRTFKDFDAGERNQLLVAYQYARGRCFEAYLTAIEAFEEKMLSVGEMSHLLIISALNPERKNEMIPLTAFASLPVLPDPNHLRTLAAAAPGPWDQPSDAVIIGSYNGHQVLIEGYLRSLIFLRLATPEDRIKALVPLLKT